MVVKLKEAYEQAIIKVGLTRKIEQGIMSNRIKNIQRKFKKISKMRMTMAK